MTHDLTDRRFGRLVAQRHGQARRPGKPIPWSCICDCGNETVVASTQLVSGYTKSCGCLCREMMTTHGHSGNGKDIKPTPTYRSWTNMIARCTQPSSPAFLHYKKRGITICERWRFFENFVADMGERPDGTTLDHHPNNDGNYEPWNCRWATKREQGNNRVTNIFFLYRGKTYTLTELARATGVAKETLRIRLVRPGGWSVKDAVDTPVIPRHLRKAGLSKRKA